MKSQTYNTITKAGTLDQVFELKLSFVEMHFITSALAVYRRSKEFFESNDHRQESFEKFDDEVLTLYCTDEIPIVRGTDAPPILRELGEPDVYKTPEN